MFGAFRKYRSAMHLACPACRAALPALAILAAMLLVTVAASAPAQEPDSATQTWVDETGTHKIEAKFIKLDGPNVVLQTADGKQINVPYAKFNLSSQLQAKKADNPKAFEPPPLPSSFAPPPLRENPFPEDPTIDQFLEVLLVELKADRLDVFWFALPADMQGEVESIVIKVADLAGPKFFKQLQVVLPHALTIVRDKRSFILANPRIARQPPVLKTFSAVLPALEPLLEVLTRPATWSSENFKAGKVGPWIVAFVNDLSKANKQLTAVIAQLQSVQSTAPVDYKAVTYKVTEKTTDTAKVEFETPGKPKQEVAFKKVGRTWLPAEVADKGLAGLVAARSYLEGMDKAGIDQLRSNLTTGLTVANGVLGSLANAKTQQEFNQMIDPWIMRIEPVVRQTLTPPKPQPGTPGAPQF